MEESAQQGPPHRQDKTTNTEGKARRGNPRRPPVPTVQCFPRHRAPSLKTIPWATRIAGRGLAARMAASSPAIVTRHAAKTLSRSSSSLLALKAAVLARIGMKSSLHLPSHRLAATISPKSLRSRLFGTQESYITQYNPLCTRSFRLTPTTMAVHANDVCHQPRLLIRERKRHACHRPGPRTSDHSRPA